MLSHFIAAARELSTSFIGCIAEHPFAVSRDELIGFVTVATRGSVQIAGKWTEEGIVATIMIRCPAKGRAVSTGIEVLDVDQLPAVTATMLCPACGGVHKWTKNEAWLSADGEQYRKAFAA
ncbi:MAG TPA: hypothetical protein VH684_23380 [Xanthobacteraceae bacterium]|jgi:hypothetical protein